MKYCHLHQCGLAYRIWCLVYAESKKQYKLIYLQNKNRPTDTENKLIVTKREREGGEKNRSTGLTDTNY